jgi:hypothetical protein
MGRALSHVVRVLAIAVALNGQAVAGTLYVTPAGSDANSGTLAAPLATPGKDAGETLAGVTSDYSGAPRPQGSATDIGAHEGAALVPPTPTGLRIVKE